MLMFVPTTDGRMIRIAVFIDGGFYDAVSKYYCFQHLRKRHLNIAGLQDFVRLQTAEKEKMDISYCHVVEAHFFRGRFSAESAIHAGKIEGERIFDEMLMRAGIVQHYLPLDESRYGPAKEKGIDVWLSLEAFDLAVHKRFDVLTLLAGDGDYVPLIRKLNGIGTRVMLLGWDFSYEFTNPKGEKKKTTTRTDTDLIKAATYPIMMHTFIDDRTHKTEMQNLIDNMFCK